jgi:8-oxo-dGTP diphosphatase
MDRPPQREPLPVVCAVVVDNAGRVLVARRPAHKHLGGRWEFPGGKIEPGEGSEAALTREIREELGCEVVPFGALDRQQYDYGQVFIELIPLWVRLAPGSPPPVAVEHAALRLVDLGEMGEVDLAPADRLVADTLGKKWAGLSAADRG